MYSLPDIRLKYMLTVMTSPAMHNSSNIETDNTLTCTDDLTVNKRSRVEPP
jgi:hypothetical protein